MVDWDKPRGPSVLVVVFGAEFKSCGGPSRILVGLGCRLERIWRSQRCKGIQLIRMHCDGSADHAGIWWDLG